MALILKHQSREAFINRLHEAYRDSAGDRCMQLARFIVAATQTGDLTDVECRGAWGMTAGQWSAAKSRMNTRIAAENTVRGAVGE